MSGPLVAQKAFIASISKWQQTELGNINTLDSVSGNPDHAKWTVTMRTTSAEAYSVLLYFDRARSMSMQMFMSRARQVLNAATEAELLSTFAKYDGNATVFLYLFRTKLGDFPIITDEALYQEFLTSISDGELKSMQEIFRSQHEADNLPPFKLN